MLLEEVRACSFEVLVLVSIHEINELLVVNLPVVQLLLVLLSSARLSEDLCIILVSDRPLKEILGLQELTDHGVGIVLLLMLAVVE